MVNTILFFYFVKNFWKNFFINPTFLDFVLTGVTFKKS